MEPTRSAAPLLRVAALVSAALAATFLLVLLVASQRGFWIWRLEGGYVASDFVAYYAAGRMALQGLATQVYDWAVHHRISEGLIGPFKDELPWLNPPHFLLVVLPFAFFSYPVALVAWCLATLAAYAAAIARIVGSRWGALFALSFPGVLINVASGQAGLLNAAVFGAALAALPTRPILAGLFFGALTIKPQLGLLVPLALLSGGHVRTILAAMGAAVLFAATSALILPASLWPSFFASLSGTGHAIVTEGLAGWGKMQSFYGVARGYGLDPAAAWGVAGVSALTAALLVVGVWRSRCDHEIKAAALVLGSLLVQPYVFIYDEALLGIALAFLLRHALRTRFLPYEAVVMSLVYIPLIQAVTLSRHLGLLACLIALACLMRRLAAFPERGRIEV